MDLKELLGEELFNQIGEKLGDKKLIVNDGSYIPKAKFDEKNEELKATKSKMEELQKSVEGLESYTKENAELKSKIDNLKGEYEQFKNEADTRVQVIQKKQSIERNLVKANANPDTIDLLIGQFDIDKIQVDSKGEIVDWDNHFEPIKTSRKSLFAESSITGDRPVSGGQVDKLSVLREKLNTTTRLDEKIALKRTIQELEQK